MQKGPILITQIIKLPINITITNSVLIKSNLYQIFKFM